MEELNISEDYKKAYNRADILCRYMPHLLKDIDMPEYDMSEYSKGFKDRVRQFEQDKDKDQIKSRSKFSLEEMKQHYRDEIEKGKNNKSRESGLDRDF